MKQELHFLNNKCICFLMSFLVLSMRIGYYLKALFCAFSAFTNLKLFEPRGRRGRPEPKQWRRSACGSSKGREAQESNANSELPQAQPNSNSESTQNSIRIRFGTTEQAHNKKVITFIYGVRLECSWSCWKAYSKAHAKDLAPASEDSRSRRYGRNIVTV